MDINSPLAIIAALLGLAYPLLLQSIERLDEKYNSELILKFFLKEKTKKFFLVFLIISLLLTFFSLLGKLNWSRPDYINLGDSLNSLIDNSATKTSKWLLRILLLSTTLLVGYFFALINKILIYYKGTEFTEYLIKKNKASDDSSILIRILIDLQVYSFRNKNYQIYKAITDYSYDLYRDIQDRNSDDPNVEYDYLKALVYNNYKLFVTLSNDAMEYDIKPLSIGLLLNDKNGEITEYNFRWIWKCLSLVIKYKKTDIVIDYWKEVFNYVSRLRNPLNEENTKQIDNGKKIENLLEFQYKLGGLLMCEEYYSCIKRMFRFTNSEPAKYELLPQVMDEIFFMYFEFNHSFNHKYSFIAQEYPFPKMEGLNADYVVKNWISKYIALLFLRQWTLANSYYFNEPLADPSNIPTKQDEREYWINSLGYFKQLVEEILNNKTLLKEVGFENLNNEEWYAKNKKTKPLVFIDKLINKIKQNKEDSDINQQPSEKKEKKFNESTKTILVSTFKQYDEIKNENPIEKYKSWFFSDGYVQSIVEKSFFTDDRDVQGFDYIYANNISERFQRFVSEYFFINKTKKYLLKPEDISKAFHNLDLKKEEHIIIGFGLNKSGISKIKGLNDNVYNEIKFVNIGYGNPLFWDCFYILKKSDLPQIVYNVVPEKIPFPLNEIDTDYHIYSNLIVLNTETLLREFEKSHSDKDLRKYLLLLIWVSVEFRYKENINMLCIQMHSDYKERGIIDNVDDVKKF